MKRELELQVANLYRGIEQEIAEAVSDAVSFDRLGRPVTAINNIDVVDAPVGTLEILGQKFNLVCVEHRFDRIGGIDATKGRVRFVLEGDVYISGANDKG